MDPVLVLSALATQSGKPTATRSKIIAAIRAAPSTVWTTCDADGHTLFTLAASNRNARFLRAAFDSIHWNYWCNMHVLLTLLLDNAESVGVESSDAVHIVKCVRVVLYAVRYKNALLQAHCANVVCDCGQRDDANRPRLEGGATHEERLARDTEIAPVLLERLKTRFVHEYRTYGQSIVSLRIVDDLSGGYKAVIGYRTYQQQPPQSNASYIYSAPVQGYVEPPTLYNVDFFQLVTNLETAEVEQRLRCDASLATQRNNDGCTPLHFASVAIANLLCAAGADVNAHDCAGLTPLITASMASFDEEGELVRTLLENGAALGQRDNDGRSSVHWAAMTLGSVKASLKNLEIMRDYDAALFKYLVTAQNKFGETPLHTCCLNEAKTNRSPACRAVIELLLTAGASLDVADENGKTPRVRIEAILTQQVVENVE